MTSNDGNRSGEADEPQAGHVTGEGREPYAPAHSHARVWDGSEMWTRFSDALKKGAGDVLLRSRIAEFVWTLLAGPVAYEPPDVYATKEEIEAALTSDSVERLQELYDHSKELMEREEDTRTSVEGRANALLSTAGLTATLIVGVSGLLLDSNLEQLLPAGSVSGPAFVILYTFGLYALVMSLLRAVQTGGVVRLQPFSPTRPFRVQDHAESSRLRELIREGFLSFVELREINRRKAGLLAKAQWWFGSALILLLAMAAVPVVDEPIGRLLTSVWQTLGVWTVLVLLGALVGLEAAGRVIATRRSAGKS